MTEGAPTKELRTAVRDVRVLEMSTRDLTGNHLGVLSHYGGVLDLTTALSPWSRQQLSFLTLAPILGDVVEIRSEVREEAVVRLGENRLRTPRDRSKSAHVREVTRHQETHTSTSAFSPVTENMNRYPTGEAAVESLPGSRGEIGELRQRSNEHEVASDDASTISPDLDLSEERTAQELDSVEESPRSDLPESNQSHVETHVHQHSERQDSSASSPDIPVVPESFPTRTEVEETHPMEMAVLERHRPLSQTTRTGTTQIAAHRQLATEYRRISDPRVTGGDEDADRARAPSMSDIAVASPPSPVSAAPRRSPTSNTMDGEQPAVSGTSSVISRNEHLERAASTQSSHPATTERPSMEALRAPVFHPSRASPTDTPLSASSDQLQRNSVSMETEKSASLSTHETSDNGTELDQDLDASESRYEMNELIERIDVDRLAKRLERVFERNERIERERRGR